MDESLRQLSDRWTGTAALLELEDMMLELLEDLLGSWLRERLKRMEAFLWSGRVRGVNDLDRSRLGRGGGLTADSAGLRLNREEPLSAAAALPPPNGKCLPLSNKRLLRLAVSSSAMS